MFENILDFFKNFSIKKMIPNKEKGKSKEAAKERLHLVLMQDRANVSADFLDLMKQEIIEVIKKYIEVDENAIDVVLTNENKPDGTKGVPALYANIPIKSIKEDIKQSEITNNNKDNDNSKEVQTKQENNNIKEENNVEEQKEKEEQTDSQNSNGDDKKEKDENKAS